MMYHDIFQTVRRSLFVTMAHFHTHSRLSWSQIQVSPQ